MIHAQDTSGLSRVKSKEPIMQGTIARAVLVAGVALAPIAYPSASAWAQSAAQAAPASVALFYDALNAGPGKDVKGLLMQATAPDWVSCGSNQACGARDQVIAAIAGRHREVPDLRWEIKEVLVSGNRVVVRGEASGTPAGDFLGVAYGGKSFKLMSIDVHTIEAGRIGRSYHVEDWLGAARQLSAK
jgi:predicted ester cyclase